MPATLTVNPCRGRLWGMPNRCAMEQPKSAGSQAPCWCTLEKFSAELLKQVPPEAQRKACICQACVQASQVSA